MRINFGCDCQADCSCLKAQRTCRKLWSFERYLHHELRVEPVREIAGVLERADCEDLCLHESPHCKSAVYHYLEKTCFLFTENKRTASSRFHYTSEEVEYLDNQCISESPTCQYREFPDRFLPQLDRLSRAYNLKDCQRQCDTEKEFTCRSVNFETVAKDCALSSEDISSIPQVSVQCNPQDMLLTINSRQSFPRRIYARGNPSQCFVVGTGQTNSCSSLFRWERDAVPLQKRTFNKAALTAVVISTQHFHQNVAMRVLIVPVETLEQLD
ncbi:uncharacterized protein CEXT_568901 [Caerostris extrusa]|uniref:Apple domain-containing protein n=1 Tax=Caerostris extrusa TaxID=172846 RepID=A0AAV4TF77_CAEEX|nr:uncharacterized protein CEXT_568901 [Caerostris extrusa]